jgi:hypothetical protein
MKIPYLPSPASTEHTLSQHLSQLITPRSTAPAVPHADYGLPNQEPYRKLASSKPRPPVPNPTQATPLTSLAALTQPRSVPSPIPWKELPVEKSFVSVVTPSTFSRFLHLPVEVRKRIYAYSVVNGDYGLLILRDTKAYHQAPITRVNRQIRSESLLMVYTENDCDAKNRELTKMGPSFARHLGDARVRLIRNWKWFTAKRHLFIHCLDGGNSQITYRAPDGNDEIRAVAFERATEVYRLLRSQGSTTGLSVDQVAKITEIVLRITPKPKTEKPKAEEKSAQ